MCDHRRETKAGNARINVTYKGVLATNVAAAEKQ